MFCSEKGNSLTPSGAKNRERDYVIHLL